MCGVGWGGINRVSRGKGEGFLFWVGWGGINRVSEFLGVKVRGFFVLGGRGWGG